MKHLTEMVRQHKEGKTNGIYAVCSAHPLVLEAAIRYASANQTPLLIEATSNQVDQFGGYTGMTPDYNIYDDDYLNPSARRLVEFPTGCVDSGWRPSGAKPLAKPACRSGNGQCR